MACSAAKVAKPAVSVRKMRSPKSVGRNPWLRACSTSRGSNPDSGPMSRVMGWFGSGAGRSRSRVLCVSASG